MREGCWGLGNCVVEEKWGWEVCGGCSRDERGNSEGKMRRGGGRGNRVLLVLKITTACRFVQKQQERDRQ